LAWRLYQNYKANQIDGGGAPQLGTNLNSIAPELVGGSSGPAVSPAVNTPVSITITDNRSIQAQEPEAPNTPVIPGGPMRNPLGEATEDTGSEVPEDAAMETPLVKQPGRGQYGGAGG